MHGAYGLEMKVYHLFVADERLEATCVSLLTKNDWAKKNSMHRTVFSVSWAMGTFFVLFSFAYLLLANKFGNLPYISERFWLYYVAILYNIVGIVSGEALLQQLVPRKFRRNNLTLQPPSFSLSEPAFLLSAPPVPRGGLRLPPPLPLPGRDGGADWVCTL